MDQWFPVVGRYDAVVPDHSSRFPASKLTTATVDWHYPHGKDKHI